MFGWSLLEFTVTSPRGLNKLTLKADTRREISGNGKKKRRKREGKEKEKKKISTKAGDCGE